MTYTYREPKAYPTLPLTQREAHASGDGPWRFKLLTNGVRVADGVEFADGSAVVRWRHGETPTTAVHASALSVHVVHVEGHRGRSIEWQDTPPTPAFRRGRGEQYQDECEVYRVEVLIVDHDEVGEVELRRLIEHARYPNRAIIPRVLGIETREVDWTDDHPLNQSGVTAYQEAMRLFAEPMGDDQ